VGKTFSDLYVPPQEDASTLFPCCPHHPVFSQDCSIRGKAGRIIKALGNAAPVKDSSGEIAGGIVSFVDVTELMEAREAAETADHAKSRFLATMSHEIRTPLNAILGFTEILLDEELSEEQRDALEAIERSGDTLLVLINDILDLSKIEADKIELERIPFSLENLVFEVSELNRPWAEKKDIQILCDIRDIPQQVMGDPTRLRQVLTNLMNNAVKFTDHGEIITTARTIDETDDQVHIELNVHDTGMGIPEKAYGSVFDMFSQSDGSTTRKHGGTGLGLAISRRLVRLMGGDLTVTSRLGKGSTFTFRLWLNKNGSNAFRKQEDISADEFQGRTVLIVGDDLSSSRIMQNMVREMGMKCLWAKTGQDGLDLLTAMHVDLIVVEMQIPVMNGCEFAARVRKEHSAARFPMVALSRYSSPARSGANTGHMFEAHLVKPVRRALLRSVMLRVFRHGDGETMGFVQDKPHLPSMTGLHVLLAEDNPLNQKVAMIMLSRMGHTTDLAEDGERAVQMAQSGSYDLIFMDMQLPNVNGLEATRVLRSVGLDVPIVAVTASAMKGDRERCLEAGMDDYVTKPICRRTIAEIMFKHCGRLQATPKREGLSEGVGKEQPSAVSVTDGDYPTESRGTPQQIADSPQAVQLVRNLKSALRRRSVTRILQAASGLAEEASRNGWDCFAAVANEVKRKVNQGDLRGMKEAVERLVASAEVEK
jgi:CheY-like chemotaxis protein/nitrogen-specific signal transduction histidine kinase